MIIEIKVPALSESVAEATLLSWHKKIGDPINRDENLIDIETGEIIEFQNEELEEMKRQVAKKMGYELVDHRLELFGKKIKS